MKLRLLLVVCHDVAAILLAWWLAFLLRYNLEFSAGQWQAIGQTLPWVAVVQAAAFWRFGLYRGMWRFASLPDLKRILLAVGFSILAVALTLFLVGRMENVPRSVLLLDPLLLVLIMGGSRFLYRSWRDGHLFSLRDASAAPVLVVGAGDAAAMLLRDIGRSRDWRSVGLLDDDTRKHGRLLAGIPVLGPVADIGRHAARFDVRHAIVALPASTAAERRRAAELAAAAGLAVMTVPALDDILSGRVAISQVRKVELEDLLGREPVVLDSEGLHRQLSGKVVLVTGAGGSIGSELARQIARFEPELLVFYELSEFALYAIEQEFAGRPDGHDGPAIACAVGDVKDAARLSAVFSQYRPDVVFHAAAYKHVPMMENENAWEAVRNNVLGTLRTARAAIEHGVGEFVLISTDKAVNPTNVMGASKRLAEHVCQCLQDAAADTRFVMVRFGNVLGSSGSVIPKFREQITRGGPVTVTHPDIIRYFMLIPEAAQLVLQAVLQANGKGGNIFVLDMGEPVKIADLARDMIRLSGFTEEDIRIEFTGLRPGEKLYEELLADGESTLPTPHPKLRIARPGGTQDAAWLESLETWLVVPVRGEAAVKEGLKERVPEYRPSAVGPL